MNVLRSHLLCLWCSKFINTHHIVLKITLISFFLFIFSTLFAQLPFHKQFTVNEGLPSSELFDITQDSLGRIWFASNYGVGYYDGYSFKTFSIKNGLAENSVVRIFHGKNGKLWFLSYSGKLSYYKKGKMHPFEKNKIIQNNGDNRTLLRTLMVDSSDNIWFQSKEPHNICKLVKEEILQKIDTNLIFYFNQSLSFFDDNYDKNQFYKYQSVLKQANTKEFIEKKKTQGFSNFNIHLYAEPYDVNSYYLINGKYYKLTSNKMLKHISNKDKLSYGHYFYGLRNFYEEKNGNVWIRIVNDGVYLFLANNLLKKPVHFFPNLRITRILKDRDGNYWIATDGDGIFLIPSFQFNIFNKTCGITNENILSFAINGNHMYFATNDNVIFKSSIYNGKIINVKSFIPKNAETVYGRNILCHSDGSIWIITSPFIRYDTSGNRIPLDIIIRNKLYQAIELKNHNVVIATNLGFVEYRGNRIIYDSRQNNFNRHIKTVFQDKKGTLWLGTMNGLYSYANKTFRYYGDKYPELSYRISSISECGKRLIIGTHDRGMILFDDTIYHLNMSNGLISNMIRTLEIQNDTVFWAGTNRGVAKIIFSIKRDKLNFQTVHFTVWDGLPSNEINDIKITGSELWIATNKGLASIKINKLLKTKTVPTIFFENIVINEKDTLKNKHPILNYNQNNINFFYKGIDFKRPGDITYKVKLIGIDKKWLTTKNISARYTELPAGNFTFLVKAASESGLWSNNNAGFSFTIKKHFTQTGWFLGLVILAGLLLLFGIFLLILRSQHLKAENRRKLLLSEQKALRAQMNPHFIFNSLSSIQYLILGENQQEATSYLSNFALLMRRVLENSKFNVIPLSEEIETLKLYLDLEKMRFEEKFDYKISVDTSLSTEEMMIPPMLLQPYLENAIWHGLMLKKTKGMLLLEIKKETNNRIICAIEDNGIGREKANEISIKRNNHQSTGMRNIEERIALINKIYKTNMQVEIIDLYDKMRRAAGTRIELYIPIVFEF